MTETLPTTIDDEQLGPASLALKQRSERMLRWALAKVEYACTDKEAARLAGYSTASEHGLEVTGHKCARDPMVADAIVELTRTVMRQHGPRALKVISSIMMDAKVKPETRLKAAVEVANRAGLHAVSEGKLTVEHKLSEAQMDQRILALAAELQIPREIAERMLVDPSNVVDAEYEVVQPAEPVDPEEQARRDHANALRRQRRAMSPEELEDHKAEQRRLRSERGRRKYADAQGQQTDLEGAIAAADDLFTVYPKEPTDAEA